MNVPHLLGRLSSSFFARSLGVMRMIMVSSICSGALIFSMAAIGNGNVTSIVVIAILYGYTAGICK